MRTSTTYIMTLLLISFFLFVVCTMQAQAVSCDSCGRECANACGTRHFRTCCFNYLRKRSGPPPSISIPSISDQNLDYWITNHQLERSMNNLNNGDWKQMKVEPISQEHRRDKEPINGDIKTNHLNDVRQRNNSPEDADIVHYQVIYDA